MNWLRRKLSGSSSKIKTPNSKSQLISNGEDDEPLYRYTGEEQLYGITEDLINHVKSFTIDTFKNFPRQGCPDVDETTLAKESPVTSAKIRKDLSEWQERHAILILSRVKIFGFCCNSGLYYRLLDSSADIILVLISCPKHVQEAARRIRQSCATELSQLRYKLCPGRLKEEQFWSIYFKLVRSHVIEYELRVIQQEKLKRMATGDEKSSDNSAFEVEMAEKKLGVEPPPS